MGAPDCSSPSSDALQDLREGPFSRRRAWRTFLIAETVAVPLALLTATLGGDLFKALITSHLYSWCIAALCSTSTWAFIPRIERLPLPTRRTAVVALFFLCGLVGSEIARFLLRSVLGASAHPGPRLVDLAFAMSIAGVVGLVLTTVGQLRTTIAEKERALAEREVSEARLRQAKSDAELAALQARINPHFLFNTLNSIAALIREDPAKAEAVTVQLAALFRYALQAPKVGLVSLENELRIVREYLDIEQVRIGSRLRYEIDVSGAARAERVPPLTLQPLVENAIRHGIATRVDGGAVVVRGEIAAGVVRLTVVNDRGEGAGEPGTGEGLDNVRRRLQAAFGPDSAVALIHEHGHTEARLSFPAARAASS
jgi:sensor histidine kinase YesM